MTPPPPRLLTLFIERRPELTRRLTAANGPLDRHDVLQTALTDLQSAATESRTPREARIVTRHVQSLIETLATIDRDSRATQTTTGGMASAIPASDGADLPLARGPFAALCICFVAAVVLRFLGMDELLSARVFAVICIGFIILPQPTARRIMRWMGLTRSAARRTSPSESCSPVEAMLNVCAQSFATLDDILAEIPAPAPVAAPSAELERLPAVVDFLHQCLGPLARRDAARLLDMCESLPQLMAAHGLRAVSLEAGATVDSRLWQLQPGPADPTGMPATLTPALLAEDGRVVRPGRARLPLGVSA